MKKNYLIKTLVSFLALIYSFDSLAQGPDEVGQWGGVIPFEIVPVAVANLPDGRLITWSSQFPDTWVGSGSGMTYTQIFDPFTNTTVTSTVTQTDHDMFCPGINNLADGRILAAGGTSSERTSIYDPTSETWSVAADMNVPRGYQGNVTLSDGSVFTVGGSWDSSVDGQKDAELWTPETGWVTLPGIVSDDFLYTANDFAQEGQGIYRLDNHSWLWPAPNGELFHAGPGEMMHWIDVDGNGGIGAWASAGQRGDDTYSMKGTTVMFDVGKILKVGGSRSYDLGTPAKDNSYVIDINSAYGSPATVTPAPNLAFSRTMHNSTVLPNGEVLVTGGLDHAETFTDTGARLTAEIYNPTSNTWRSVADMMTERTYHSVAVLMMDGRVFVGGGGLCDQTPGCQNHADAEVYSPPYLFNPAGNLATRPVITTAPATADYATSITVNTDIAVNSFSLVRFSAATHSTNNEQRRIPLTTTLGTSHNLTIPNREILPPGYYMLFALDANGVPSVAESILIGDAIPLATNPSLIIDMKFDETSGSTAVDDSQYGNDATIFDVDNFGATKVANTSSWGTGVFGGALETDGALFNSNTIAEIPHTPSLGALTKYITVMAWVNRNEIVNNASVFSHDYPSVFFGFHNSLYKWEFYTSDGLASCYAGYTPDTEWVHMAATYDGKMARLYANGVEICAKPMTGNIALTPTDPDANFTTFTSSGFYERLLNPSPGYNGSGVTDELDGRIDELKVYNKVLTGAEIQAVFQIGEAEASVPDCPIGTIVTEFKIGAAGTWMSGSNINANEGDEVFIRAQGFAGEYILTTPEVDGNTFTSDIDFQTSDGYQIDIGTNSGDNDGLIDIDDNGQYVLTTAEGCPVAITLQVVGSCDPGDTQIETEFRVNGVWDNIYNGQTDITLAEGTELVISATPNVVNGSNLIISTTLPDGTIVGNDFNLGGISDINEGTYIINSEEGCQISFTLTVEDVDCTVFPLMPEYKINSNAWQVNVATATLSEGAELSMSIAPENTLYTVTGPSGSILYNGSSDLIIDNVNSTDHDGIFTLTTAAGCVTEIDVTVLPVDCASVETEYQINTNAFVTGATQVDVEENSSLALSIFPNDVPYTITLPDASVVDVRANANYFIGSITPAQSGIYTFNTPVSNCTVILDVNVTVIDCSSLVTEFNINNLLWEVNQPTATMDEGSHLQLSVEPDDAPYTITFPDGTVVNVAANSDYTIANVDQSHNGDFTFTAQNGCVVVLAVTVNTVDCSTVETEYRAGTNAWIEGAAIGTVDLGSQLVLSVSPNNLPYTITDPSGTVQNVGTIGLGDYTIPVVAESDAGIYVFTTIGSGCSVTLEMNVVNPGCTNLNLIPEFSINNGTFIAGTNGGDLTLEEGDAIILSALPNTFGGNPVITSITFPDGSVQADNFEIPSVTPANNGTYTFTTATGCVATLAISVNPDCTLLNLIPEYSINSGVFVGGVNGGTLTLDQGDAIVFSALPDTYSGVPVNFSITLPDASIQADGYEITSVTPANDGTYTFTTASGCLATLELIVTPGVDCTLLNLIPEYSINAGAFVAGVNGETLTIDEGDAIVFSALPDNYNGSAVTVTITLPDGSSQADGYEITAVTATNNGTYTFTSDSGCVATLELVVTPATQDCNALDLRPEYYIENGAQQIATDGATVTVDYGNSIRLSALSFADIANDIPVTVTLPDGSTQPDNYEITALSLSDSGAYTFTTLDGNCSTTLNLDVSLCNVIGLVPEYNANGSGFVSSTDNGTITLTTGESLILSAAPDTFDGIAISIASITLPDGSTQADNFEITALQLSDSGAYMFTTDTGCTTILNLIVNEAPVVCTSTSVTVEYVINDQTTQSGGSSILMTVGDKVVLRILQDGAFTIQLPDGSIVNDEYTIENIQMAQAGVYTFTSDQGCTKAFNISVKEDDSTSDALKDMIIYPNPVRDGLLHFGLEGYMGQEINVQIDDIYGKSVIRKNFPTTHSSDEIIDISILSDGTYIVILSRKIDNEVALKKVIKIGG